MIFKVNGHKTILWACTGLNPSSRCLTLSVHWYCCSSKLFKSEYCWTWSEKSPIVWVQCQHRDNLLQLQGFQFFKRDCLSSFLANLNKKVSYFMGKIAKSVPTLVCHLNWSATYWTDRHDTLHMLKCGFVHSDLLKFTQKFRVCSISCSVNWLVALVKQVYPTTLTVHYTLWTL